MHVFVAGATGVLGRRLVSLLADRGHEVTGLVRDDDGERLVRKAGGEPRRGDVLDPDSLESAAADADIAVHAATAIPTGNRPSSAAWERNDRVRRGGTRNLLAAAEAVGANRLLLQSVVWIARRDDGECFDEDAPPNPDRTTRSALAAERLLASAADDGALEAVTLRCGWFYAHDAAHTRRIGRGLANGRMPIPGAGPLGRRDATLSYCHVEDAAHLYSLIEETLSEVKLEHWVTQLGVEKRYERLVDG